MDSENGFKEWGGYMDAKISKLEEQFESASVPFRKSRLFEGISIYVNGLTNPSADELKRLMMVHGGVYHHYQRKHTKFVIASCLPDTKIRNMDTSNLISAKWIVDCIEKNQILDYSKYLLYTNHKKSQPKLKFNHTEKPAEGNEDNVKEMDSNLNMLNEQLKLFLEDDHSEMVTKNVFIKESDSVKLNKSAASIKPQPSIAKTAVDPKFLSEFYNNSRLHHIATLGSQFKRYISELREKHNGTFPARETIKNSFLTKMEKYEIIKDSIIMHIDMDCFFVSVGLRTHKHLKGLPIAVTHSRGGNETVARPGVDRQLEMELYMKRLENKLHENIKSDKIKNGFEGKESLSEIASCSYEARKMGVRNGMFVGQALKLCPQLKTIPYDFEGYKEVAFALYDTIAQYTLNIEAVSCDEMFVDLTELLKDLQIHPMEFVSFVRNEIRTKTDCPCSAGVGINRLQARMATKRAKPDGQFFLEPSKESVAEYMSNIPISDLPGVGHSTSYTLKQNNWETCGDLQKVSLTKLQMELGKKFGETLYQFCRGRDKRQLSYDQVRKSVSAEVNYGIRFTEFEALEKFMNQLCTEVHSRLTEIKRKGKCITLKLMIRSKDAPIESSKFLGHGVCDQVSKSVSLSEFTDSLEKIIKVVMTTLKAMNIPPNELRGIGIQISKLNDVEEIKEKKDSLLKNMFKKQMEEQKREQSTNTTTINDQTRQQLKTAINSKKSPTKTVKNNKRNSTATKANVLTMLKNAPNKRITESAYNFNDIDMSVLAELPEDIRQEILGQTTYKIEQCSPKKRKIDDEFLAALPKELRHELETEINDINLGNEVQNVKVENKSKSSISNDNIFFQPEPQNILKDWINSTNSPEDFDVKMIGDHFCEFVRLRKIHVLYEPIVYLYEIIKKKKSCKWHLAYKQIVEQMQIEMISNFGGRMLLQASLNCDKCKC